MSNLMTKSILKEKKQPIEYFWVKNKETLSFLFEAHIIPLEGFPWDNQEDGCPLGVQSANLISGKALWEVCHHESHYKKRTFYYVQTYNE